MNGPAVTYSLVGDTSKGGFRVDAATGVVTVADPGKLDYETSGADHSYAVTVQASDGTLASRQTFTVAVSDVAPSVPVDADGAANTVAEGAAVGTRVGITASSTDVNGPAVTYSLVGDTSGGGFRVDAATGAVAVADGSKLDYESAPGHAYSVTVQASDGTLASRQTFVIGVSDVAPSVPVDADGATNTVAEGAAAGTPVGVTAASSDVNGGAITYSIAADSSGGGFAVDPRTGVVTVADPGKLDYESAPGHAYGVTVAASDGTLSSSQTFAVAVTDVAPTVPTDADAATDAVVEGAAAGSATGVTAASADPNGPAVTYTLTADSSGGGFQVDPATGAITVKDPSRLDYEATAPGHAHTVTVTAAAGALSSSQTFTIAVADAPPAAPTDADATAADGVTEGAGVGTYTGIRAASSDVNGGAVTLSLSDDAGGRFAIGADGRITVTEYGAAHVDYESSGGRYTVVVRADDGTLASESAFVVPVADAAPAVPTDAGAGANAVVEGAAAGTNTGVTARALDPNGGTVTYAIVDDGADGRAPAGAFAVDKDTGIVTVKDGGLIDYESAPSLGQGYTLKVQASDPKGLTSTGVITIAVTDAAPSQPTGGTGSVMEGAAADTSTGLTVSAVDPGTSAPGPGGAVTYALTNDAGGLFTIDANSGVVSVSAQGASGIDYESTASAGHSYTITAVARDSSGLSSQPQNFTIGVTDVAPRTPTDGDQTDNRVLVDAADGTGTGVRLSAADVNGGKLTYGLAAGQDGSGRFTVNPDTGAILVKAGHPAFEAGTTYTITGTVSDGASTVSSAPIDIFAAGNRITLDLDGNNSSGAAGNDYKATFTEGEARVAIADGDDAITNPGNPGVTTATSAQIVLTNYKTGDNLAAAGLPGGITASGSIGPGTLTVTLTGTATYAQYAEAIQAITFSTTGDAPDTTPRIFQTTVTDATGTSPVATTTIAVNAVNDAPVLSLGGTGNSVTYTEKQTNPLSTALFTTGSVADPDQPANFAGGSYTAQITGNAVAVEDQLVLRAGSGFTVDGASVIYNGVTIGTVDPGTALGSTKVTIDLNAAATPAVVNALTTAFGYRDTSSNPSTADRTVSLTFNDGGNTGSENPLNKLNSNTVTQTVHVVAVNDAPVVPADTAVSGSEDTAIKGTLTATDVDNTANQISYSVVAGPQHGTLVLNAGTGAYTYTPSLNYNGTDAFTYKANDTQADSNTGTVTINLAPVNDVPVPVADALSSVTEDSGPRTIQFSDLTGNDGKGAPDEAGQTLTVTAVSNAVGGNVTISNGAVVFTPTANFNGTASFDYTVRDNGTTNGASDFKSAVGTVSFSITPVNDVPAPVADTLSSVAEDSGPRAIAFTALTGNDSPGANEAGQTLTVTAVSNAVGGNVTISNGAVVFTPTANFNGTASFDYTATDDGTTNGVPDPKSATGHASFTITPVNDAPVLDLDSTDGSANTGYAVAAQSGGAAVPVAGANVRITDVDNATLSGATVTLTIGNATDLLSRSGALPTGIAYSSATTTTTQVVTLSGTASLADYQTALQRVAFSTNDTANTSTRTVTVTVDDGQASDHASNTATTTITVSGNQAPVAVNDTSTSPGATAATEAGGTNNGTAGVNGTGNVLANDTDDRDTGRLVVSSVKYGTTAGTVGQALVGAHGALTLRADGSYTYVVDNADAAVQALNPTQTLTDSFTYTARDTGGLDSNAAALTVTIKGANDAPTANADAISATEAGGVANGTAGTNPTGNVLANDTDPDSGDSRTVAGVAAGTNAAGAGAGVDSPITGAHGTLTVKADGGYSYVVNQADGAVQALRTFSQTVTDTFTYTVKDAAGLTSTAQATVTIHGQNDAPVAVADTASATEAGGTANGTAGTNPTGNVLANDTDPDAPNGFSAAPANGETQTVQGIAKGDVGGTQTTGVGTTVAGSYGSLVINVNGSYSYTVDNANASVQALNTGGRLLDTFTYTVKDAAGATSTSTLTVTVNGANDAPTAASFTAPTGNEDTNQTITLQGSDVDGTVAGYHVTALPSSVGTLYSDSGYSQQVTTSTTLTSATLYFKPAANYAGTGSFTYTATDNGNATSAPATVTLNVAPVADGVTATAFNLTPTGGTEASTYAAGTYNGYPNQSASVVSDFSGGYIVVYKASGTSTTLAG